MSKIGRVKRDGLYWDRWTCVSLSRNRLSEILVNAVSVQWREKKTKLEGYSHEAGGEKSKAAAVEDIFN